MIDFRNSTAIRSCGIRAGAGVVARVSHLLGEARDAARSRVLHRSLDFDDTVSGRLITPATVAMIVLAEGPSADSGPRYACQARRLRDRVQANAEQFRVHTEFRHSLD